MRLIPKIIFVKTLNFKNKLTPIRIKASNKQDNYGYMAIIFLK